MSDKDYNDEGIYLSDIAIHENPEKQKLQVEHDQKEKDKRKMSDDAECKHSNIWVLEKLSKTPNQQTSLQRIMLQKLEKQNQEIERLETSNTEIVDILLTDLCNKNGKMTYVVQNE